MIISSALVLVWFLQSKQAKPAQDLTIDMAITRIDNKDFKEAAFKQSSVEFTDNADNKFVTTIGRETTGELLLKKIDEFNKANPANVVKVSEEPASNGMGWLILINALPFILLIGFLA